MEINANRIVKTKVKRKVKRENMRKGDEKDEPTNTMGKTNKRTVTRM